MIVNIIIQHISVPEIFNRKNPHVFGIQCCEQMEPLAEEITGKAVNFDPLTIFSCISFPRPMDEGLQRHSLNVALLNAMQAEWLGLKGAEIKVYTLAGLLHDIGKTMIFMPSDITTS